MKYKMRVSHVGDKDTTWWETSNDPEVTTQPQATRAALEMVRGFNRTLRPGEAVREVVSVRLIEFDGYQSDAEALEKQIAHLERVSEELQRELDDCEC